MAYRKPRALDAGGKDTRDRRKLWKNESLRPMSKKAPDFSCHHCIYFDSSNKGGSFDGYCLFNNFRCMKNELCDDIKRVTNVEPIENMAEKDLQNSDISDQTKYLIDHKIEVLKSLTLN